VAGGSNLFGSKASDLVATGAAIVSGSDTTTVGNNSSASVKAASTSLYSNAISQAKTNVTTTTSQLTAATNNLALAQTNTDTARLDLQIAIAAGASAATIASLTSALTTAERNESNAGLIVNGLSANEIGAFETLLYNENQFNLSNSTSAFILANSTSTFDDPSVLPEGYGDDGNLLPGYQLDEENNPVFVGTDFSYNDEVFVGGFPAYDDDGNLLPGYDLDEDNNPIFVGFDNLTGAVEFLDSVTQESTLNLARQQASIASQRRQINNSDWRVRLRLAPTSQYLYNAPNPGILQPLKNTDGVIFPYTPKIDTSYRANYNSYDLVHSNYRGYFYQNSFVDPVNISCDFTAQDTSEADYLLAVMHFFKSATKMFYGQDAQRGAPPPLVYLSGLGEYQFNEHPLVISQFNLSLPNDVDYIRAGSTNINGTDLLSRRLRQNLPTNPLSGALQRLYNLGQNINKGAEDFVFAPPTLGENRPTYVPTKMNITLTLLPVQSRASVSKQFSVKSFANGDLIRGGFW
jgi:multidrug efflux pump subunit AcrA (membrane-fusion protein)